MISVFAFTDMALYYPYIYLEDLIYSLLKSAFSASFLGIIITVLSPLFSIYSTLRSAMWLFGIRSAFGTMQDVIRYNDGISIMQCISTGVMTADCVGLNYEFIGTFLMLFLSLTMAFYSSTYMDTKVYPYVYSIAYAIYFSFALSLSFEYGLLFGLLEALKPL